MPKSCIRVLMDAAWRKLQSAARWAGLQVLAGGGRIPAHIAIIMDGNRRFADKAGMDRSSGHALGYESMIRTLELCLDLGVRYVSVYAFSIDNFGRSADEVSALMELMREKLDLLVSRQGMARERGIRLRIIGDLSLLPDNLTQSVQRAMAATESNDKAVLNICVAYTSTQEMTHAVKMAVAEALQSQEPRDGDYCITSEDIERHMYTAGCPPPDLLIRTSGETRLSNFMLWQCGHSYLAFCKVLWPDFSLWDFFRIIMEYQSKHRSIVN